MWLCQQITGPPVRVLQIHEKKSVQLGSDDWQDASGVHQHLQPVAR